MNYRYLPLLLLLLMLAIGAPLRADPTVEEGAASSVPWSGWWWPAKTGYLVLGYRGEPGALVKHDRLSGKKAAAWEQSHLYHFDPAGGNWWGHCHAWAAASLTEKEPLHDVYEDGMFFHVGDIKGLLTEAHYDDHGPFYGQRFNALPGDDYQDMYPSLVWYVLRKYLHDNQTALIFDLDPGVEVDSHPVYRYRLTAEPIGGNTYQGQLTLWAADYQVSPDFLGTATIQKNYTFAFTMHDGQIVAGSDYWTGESVKDHPDFAWYPAERGQENPELDYDGVSRLDVLAR